MGWFKRMTCGLVLAVSLVIAVPSQAGAGLLGDYTGTGVRIRTQPNTSSTIVGYGYPGHYLCAYASSGSWYYHSNLTTGKVGWSSATYVGFFYPFIGC